MKIAHPVRLGVSITVGLMLVSALAVQSAGIALTKKAPDTAITAFPLNGLAYENIASAVFLATTETTGSPKEGAKAARPWALEAYRREPLVPKAHAILALAEDVPERRKTILDAALALNRREPRLQAVVLQEQVANADYPAAIASLDRILRVKPSQDKELFPILTSVFAQREAISEFARILDGSAEWHIRFFRFAARQPSALQNLAILRSRTSFNDEIADRALLRNLEREGDIETAYAVYREVAEVEGAKTIGTWRADYPPFDWSLTDEAGLRAQASLSGEKLEISVKPGRGGVVARRWIRVLSTPFRIRVDHSIDSEQALQDIDLTVRCPSTNIPILETNLSKQENGYLIDSLPVDCAFVEVAISARAWSGRPALNEDIDAITLAAP